MNYSRRQLEAFGEPLGDSVTRTKPGGRIYGGGGAPAAPEKTTVTQTSIPDYAKPYVERMLGKSEALANAPYQAYGGERIAGFDPLQEQAFQGVANLQPSQQLGTATQMAGMAGLGSLGAGQQYARNATDPFAMQAYMSPYMQNALAPQLREAEMRSNMQGQQNQAQAAQQGAFGGSRTAIVEAERQRNLGQLQGDIYGKGMQSAFDSARQAQQFGADLGLRGYGQGLQAAGQLGQLGQSQFNQQKDILNAQSAAGAQRQGLEQQRLGQQYQDFLDQRGYNQKQLAFLSDMLRGLPLSQSTQQMYQAPPSLASQAVGLGTAGYGLYQNAKGSKEGGSIYEEDSPAGLAELAINKTLSARKK